MVQVRGPLFGTNTFPALSAGPHLMAQVKYYSRELICYCTVKHLTEQSPKPQWKTVINNVTTSAKWFQTFHNEICYSALKLWLSSHNSAVMYVKGRFGFSLSVHI